jgi:hypothetical protein
MGVVLEICLWLPIVAVVLGRGAFALLWRRTVGYRVWMSYGMNSQKDWARGVRELRHKDAPISTLESIPNAFLLSYGTRLRVLGVVKTVVNTVVVASSLLMAGAFVVINVVGLAVLVGQIVNAVYRHRMQVALESAIASC